MGETAILKREKKEGHERRAGARRWIGMRLGRMQEVRKQMRRTERGTKQSKKQVLMKSARMTVFTQGDPILAMPQCPLSDCRVRIRFTKLLETASAHK